MEFTPEEIIMKLKKLIKKIEHIQAVVKGIVIDITPSQGRIIHPIVKGGKGYSIQELSEHASVDKALVSRTIADLESKGYVEREKTADNIVKNHKIVLSEKGRKLFLGTLKPHREEFEKWLRQFTEVELLNFILMLDKLTQ